MITNPNTLGLFEDRIAEISEAVHKAGGLVYMDGANFNAIVGQARPGDFGVDAMHINLHKTFSTPHGGGGPGAGPVVCSERLLPYLPIPRIARHEDGSFHRDWNRPKSIGRVRSFLGNVGVCVRAWAFIKTLGLEGLREMSATAVLNANYLLARLRETFDVPFGEGRCMHEFVIDATKQKKAGARAMDLAKGLLDRGIHPPTTYFPLVVPEALMIEPTESESRSTLDSFADVLIELANEAETRPEAFAEYPRTTPISRPDEAAAARRPLLVWNAEAASHFGRGAGGAQ
jgi:glycine dehydrogenase subunit 2